MFKKLGMQIVIITSICIAVVVAIMLTVTIVAFHSYNDSIMLERAVVGMQVLEDTVEDEIGNLEDAFSMFKEDGDFRDAAVAADEAVLKSYMQKELPAMTSQDHKGYRKMRRRACCHVRFVCEGSGRSGVHDVSRFHNGSHRLAGRCHEDIQL